MKNVFKVLSYSLAAFLVFLLSPDNAVAASNRENNSLTIGQIIGGMTILAVTILVPIIRRRRKRGAPYQNS